MYKTQKKKHIPWEARLVIITYKKDKNIHKFITKIKKEFLPWRDKEEMNKKYDLKRENSYSNNNNNNV